MNTFLTSLAGCSLARAAFLPLLRALSPGDITIRHHWTGEPVRLDAFKHKGYWFYGARRERASMLLLERLLRPGDVVLDVGGHIGYVALFLADRVGPEGRVYSFEPGPNNLPYIRWNAGGAKYRNIVVVEEAVAAEDGVVSLWVEELTGQNNSIVPGYHVLSRNAASHHTRVPVTETRVPCVSLDSFVRRHALRPRLVKIDVEGAEYEVLRGMRKVLTDCRPVVMLEVTLRHEEVLRLLHSSFYILFDDAGREVRTAGELVAAEGNNFFAAPVEDTASLRALGVAEAAFSSA